MTVSEYLRFKANKLRHAFDRGAVVFDSNQNLIQEIEPLHFLTCERCRLEKEVLELERNTTTESTGKSTS